MDEKQNHNNSGDKTLIVMINRKTLDIFHLFYSTVDMHLGFNFVKR
jgi:hypothetical protein